MKKNPIDFSKYDSLVLLLNEDAIFKASYSYFRSIHIRTKKVEISFNEYVQRIIEKSVELMPDFENKKLGPQMYGIYWSTCTDLREKGCELFALIQELPVYNDVA